jgi:hypothetical protein
MPRQKHDATTGFVRFVERAFNEEIEETGGAEPQAAILPRLTGTEVDGRCYQVIRPSVLGGKGNATASKSSHLSAALVERRILREVMVRFLELSVLKIQPPNLKRRFDSRLLYLPIPRPSGYFHISAGIEQRPAIFGFEFNSNAFQ